MKFLGTLIGALAWVSMAMTPAFAAVNALPAVPGPGGVYITATPTVNIGYDSGSGLACVVGATPTCVLSTTAGGGGGGSASYTAAATPYSVTAGVNKPAGVSTVNSAQWIVPVKPGTVTEIDLSAPQGVLGTNGTTIASGANPFPVTGPLTDTQLRATAVPISGTVTATGPLTDAQLRATAVPISGTVTANFGTIAGAATAAKQPALGTAGSSSTDVLSVQGIAGGTPLKIDGGGLCSVTAAYDGTSNLNLCGFNRAVADAAISTNATKTKLAPTAASTDGITPVVMSSATACLVLKASPGNFYSLSGNIGAAGYVMVFDATSAPADGTVTPKIVLQTGAAGTFSIAYSGLPPAVFATGITACASSTGPYTKTAYSTSVFMSGQVF